ncbi:MAG TPA: 50S ribosomal protein L11 methyltransferase [Pyrinomonadaceae bacterium]|nr:50S ribosomal protein L11 methyltransferase [Pyrinomonadaceae bacterium]
MNEQGIGRTERTWCALDVAIEPSAREAIEYALMEAGALGTELNEESGKQALVIGYFPMKPDLERVNAELLEALRIYELPPTSVGELKVREVPDEDWLGEWKKNWQPVEVGRFIVAPPWSEIKTVRDRIVIRIEPGMAFGTGTHETTRLCLKAITRFFKGGSFLDVGTGSGILAIAAAKSFPLASIDACDTDADAIAIARENARLNEVAEQINFRVGSLEESSTPSADFVCANLTANLITPLLPLLTNASCGRLVLSGILDSQIDLVVDALHALGASGNFVMMQEGEWIALVA